MALTNDDAGSIYIRVELPRVHGKYLAQFDLIQYVNHPLTGEKAQIDRQTMECDYNLDGPNIFEQCYEHAKKELPYATIDC
ncbi:hypothetical protein MXT04_24650 [Escherichia coli]|uniref:hypothetical protein n=1 Tax=Escherichia coli TaxID=562 RepID=UPI0019BDC185|nr:hypothetical protein [Escherichia coli]MBI9595733.1 hypothetical protein [Escherichia coli]MDT9429925.1 hypothetical protein [Escherichia coli]MDT9471750.1 hypothetical protein [Escherichia coli]